MKRIAKATLRKWTRLLLHTHDSPERTSFAFALGVFVAFLPPVPWFHTVFALLLAFVFRLNRVAIIVGTYTNTPFTMAPLVILETSLGVSLLGEGDIPELTLRQFRTYQGWKDAAAELTPLIRPLLLGSVLLGILAAAIAYFAALGLIGVYRRRIAAAAAAAAASAAAVVANAAAHAAEAAAKAASRARAEAEADAQAEAALNGAHGHHLGHGLRGAHGSRGPDTHESREEQETGRIAPDPEPPGRSGDN